MYFATKPSRRSTAAATQPGYAPKITRRYYGSRRDESAVEPTRSQNSTVSCRRSAEDVGAAVVPGAEAGGGTAPPGLPSLAPQSEQNFAPGRLVPPHAGHRAGTGAPHSSQNLLPSRTSARQLGHSMPHLNLWRRSA